MTFALQPIFGVGRKAHTAESKQTAASLQKTGQLNHPGEVQSETCKEPAV